MKKRKKIIALLLSVFSSMQSINGQKSETIAEKAKSDNSVSKLNANVKQVKSNVVTNKLDKKKILALLLPVVATASYLIIYKLINNKTISGEGGGGPDTPHIPNTPNNPNNPIIPLINNNPLENIKFSDFESLNFDNSMVEKININDPVLRYYERYDENIKVKYSNPEQIMGTNFSEDDMRQNPKKYFLQDQNNHIYVKDMSGQLHCTGKIIIPSLKELLAKANNVENKKGTLNIVYGNSNLLDIHNALDSGVFQFANPASNFNAIETTYPGDFNKKLSAYVGDPTQGPWFMKKCPWTSLFLLHVLNGKKISNNLPVTNKFAKNLFQVMDNGQFELNILGDYGIKTSAGYIANDIPPNFENKTNDGLYRSLIVENAPASLRGGNSKTPYTYLGDKNTINIYIDAAIPGCYGKSYDKKDIIPHLWRHYMSMISYCKVKGIKNALISLTGNGVFNVPLDYHLKVLSSKKIQNAIENSGTNFIVNGYTSVNFLLNGQCTSLPWSHAISYVAGLKNHKYKCTNVENLHSWQDVFRHLGLE